MRLVLTADTHLPKRARDLPEPLWTAIETADVVLHAGDWVDESLLDAMTARARRLIGVYGNNDGPALRARLPEVARVELDGLRVAVVHETGPSDRSRAAVRGPVPRRRPAGLRALAHPLGHRGARRAAPAQPGLTHRPPLPAARHLPDRRDRRRAASTDGRAAPPATPQLNPSPPPPIVQFLHDRAGAGLGVYWPRPVSAWSSSIRLDASALVRSSGNGAPASRASVAR